jgi:hypothetical protein
MIERPVGSAPEISLSPLVSLDPPGRFEIDISTGVASERGAKIR